eukprot:GHVS01077593.1.p3 GENE.GHVS01077593.1~~GHVS01077593.1.p3  ORF type:complete len:106 (+),score=12.57 GHVS01077593.1:215-532(+)
MKGIFINPEEDSGTPPPAVSARKLTATSKKNFSNNNARSGALADRNVIKLVVIKMAASQRKARHMIRQLCTTSTPTNKNKRIRKAHGATNCQRCALSVCCVVFES